MISGEKNALLEPFHRMLIEKITMETTDQPFRCRIKLCLRFPVV